MIIAVVQIPMSKRTPAGPLRASIRPGEGRKPASGSSALMRTAMAFDQVNLHFGKGIDAI